MPDDMFNNGAITISKVSFRTGETYEELAHQLWYGSVEKRVPGYSKAYADDDPINDWVTAAKKTIAIISKDKSEYEIAAALAELASCFDNLNPDGSQKKKKIFGGTLFNKVKVKNDNRVSDYLKTLSDFRSHLLRKK